jgi:hypothetical protein
MALNTNASYIDKFRGCCLQIDDIVYLTTPRVQSLSEQILNHKNEPEIISSMIHMVLAV